MFKDYLRKIKFFIAIAMHFNVIFSKWQSVKMNDIFLLGPV